MQKRLVLGVLAVLSWSMMVGAFGFVIGRVTAGSTTTPTTTVPATIDHARPPCGATSMHARGSNMR